jgi:hypothetical protein
MIRSLLTQQDNPIVFEVESPSTSRDPYAARRITFYERLGAQQIPFSEEYVMPNLDGGGTLPMRLFDMAPERRPREWQPGDVRHLIKHIWTDCYNTDKQDARLLELLRTV